MSKSEEQNEELAAGGVVVDYRNKDAPSVLVIHRPRYDDWSFPKGKIKGGETIEDAAIREVEEETGIKCRITRELESLRYIYRTRAGKLRPKLVHYFLMKPVKGEIQIAGDEVDAVEWLDAREAKARLTYEHDKRLLRSLLDE
ncbi:MAG TPA: NUDIX hydrolase [Blastocatellia bacterium]|nr:NUDIX hydrolase [Blastocatellia bacterium]